MRPSVIFMCWGMSAGAAVACGHPSAEMSALPSQTPEVPPVAPDTVPKWFSDDSSWTSDDPRNLKHVIGLFFKHKATPAQRQSVIAAIGGEVIGGWQYGPGVEGVYAVKLHDETDIWSVLKELQRAGDAAVAFPIYSTRITN